MELESEIERLPLDILAHIFTLISSFRDLAQASGVCRRWRRGVEQSLAGREKLSFNGWKMDDESAARLVRAAYSLKELDISRSCWGCQITDAGLYQISFSKCASSLTSISLWGMAGITDKGVVQLVSKTTSLQHLNVGGTFITDESLSAIANNCPHLKKFRLVLIEVRVRDPDGPVATKGRPPQATRIKSGADLAQEKANKKQRTCGFCKEKGHYITSCHRAKTSNDARGEEKI